MAVIDPIEESPKESLTSAKAYALLVEQRAGKAEVAVALDAMLADVRDGKDPERIGDAFTARAEEVLIGTAVTFEWDDGTGTRPHDGHVIEYLADRRHVVLESDGALRAVDRALLKA